MFRISTPRALVPFRSGRYRLLSGALVANLVGSGMWVVATAWQLVQLGASLGWFGAVATAGTGALALAALLGGVTADRSPPRRVIVAAGSLKAVAVLSVVVAGASDAVEPVHLVVAGVVLGAADGFFYPAYSALVPAVVAGDELLAVNGVEAMLRPVMIQAVGPALASALISLISPTAAFSGIALVFASSAVLTARMRRPDTEEVPPRQRTPAEPSGATASPGSVLRDLREGFTYVATTRWLVLTLVLAVTIMVAYTGSVQVLLPLVIADRTEAGPEGLALVLAGYGVGGIVGSLVMSSLRLPRRYLTVMLLAWGAGCLPLAIVGLTGALWQIAVALFLCAVLNACASALWGTLLQRRVPRHMLGRVSSLDFFVSLSAAPLSAALVVPAAGAWGIPAVYLVIGLLPISVSLLALALGGLRRDEAEHPLH